MNKPLAFVAAFLASLMGMSGAPWAVAGEELNLYLWANYIDPDVVSTFERQHGVTIRISTFDSDDQREETLLLSQGRGWDIICVSEAYMMASPPPDWITPLEFSLLPNLRHVELPLTEIAPEARRYGVPYFWGTAGIAYRTDLVKTPPRRWRDLFDLAPQYPGKILQPSTLRLLMGIGLLAAGADMNSENPADLQRASSLLLGQIPHLFGYETSNLSETNALVTGEAVMAPMFNGDVLTIREFQPNIDFVYPEEGANVWADFLVVTDSSNDKALAFKFLNYLNEPSVARANAEFVRFATPNMAAKALAEADYRNNPVIFPPEDALHQAHVIKPVSEAVLRQQSEIFVRTMSRFEMQLEGH